MRNHLSIVQSDVVQRINGLGQQVYLSRPLALKGSEAITSLGAEFGMDVSQHLCQSLPFRLAPAERIGNRSEECSDQHS